MSSEKNTLYDRLFKKQRLLNCKAVATFKNQQKVAFFKWDWVKMGKNGL